MLFAQTKLDFRRPGEHGSERVCCRPSHRFQQLLDRNEIFPPAFLGALSRALLSRSSAQCRRALRALTTVFPSAQDRRAGRCGVFLVS